MVIKNDIKKIELTDELELMLNSAMRYCMGSRTYMPRAFCSYIKSIMKDLSLLTLERMKNDFENHDADVKRGLSSWGDEFDKEEWMKFKVVLDAEMDARAVKE